jgi:hypothetical protein
MGNPQVQGGEVKGWPGWTKLQMGGSRRYRSPGGIEISADRFAKLVLKYKGQAFVPESDVLPPNERNRPAFFTSTTRTKTTNQEKATSNQKGVDQPKPNVSDGVIDLPDATPRPGRARGPKASAKELTDGIHITLSIVTSIVAMFVKESALAMTPQDATNIAIPMANLLYNSPLNDRFGRMIADSGDWQLLGYAIFVYLGRVSDSISQRGGLIIGGKQHQQPPHPPMQSQPLSPPPSQPSLSSNVSSNGFQGLPPSVRPSNIPYYGAQ